MTMKCPNGYLGPPFSFKGQIKDDILIGPGMLKLYEDLNNDEKFIKNEFTCFQLPKLDKSEIKAIVGTWTNGALQGTAKLTLNNGKVVIASFNDGVFHGMRRDFNATGSLYQVSYWQDGVKTKFAWESFNSTNLVFSTIVEEGFPTKALAISKNGGISGDYYDGFSMMNALYQPVNLESVTNEDDCFKILNWSNGESLRDSRLGLNNSDTTPKPEPLCVNNIAAKQTMLSFYRQLWSAGVEGEFHQVLWSMQHYGKPQEAVNEGKCFQLIGKVKLDDNLGQLKTRLMNSTEDVVFKISEANVDENMYLHGHNSINVIGGFGGQDPTLNWTVRGISGHWMHGELTGIATLLTTQNQMVVAHVEKNCIHGPVIIVMTVPILPVSELSKTLLLQMIQPRNSINDVSVQKCQK